MRFALLSKTFRFEAAHSLPGHRGKCARPHGHSYKLEVTLRGPIQEMPGQSEHGMVMDFEELSRIVRCSILEQLDHRDLNEVTSIQTTAENLVHWMWSALVAAGLASSLLYRLRLWETESGYVEITQAEREEMDGEDVQQMRKLAV
ncbi:MAG: 6-carboxytetrahydropterin synthase QueD [Ktedonobacteraceae bacterium]